MSSFLLNPYIFGAATLTRYSQSFTATGVNSFTVPAGATEIYCLWIGGGGGGAGSEGDRNEGNTGGGGGGMAISVGRGGQGGPGVVIVRY